MLLVLVVAGSAAIGLALPLALASVWPDRLGPLRGVPGPAQAPPRGGGADRGLDQAALSALQHARQLDPLAITALHVAVDPDHARELGRLWAWVHIPIPLEVVDAPDRNLLAAVEEAVAERVRPDTEVTVLVPRRRYVGFWRRVLHDQTSAGLTKVLGAMENVNVTIVPFHPGSQRQLYAVRGT
jgi:hypothetical protein